MWFKTKKRFDSGCCMAPEKCVNCYSFPFARALPVLGQDEGAFEGLVNLVQWQFGWAQWKISIYLLTSLIPFLYEQ